MAIDEQLQSLVYFLTDHLFAAMEAGERIRMATFTQPENLGELSGDDIMQEIEQLRLFISDLSDWEEEMVSKLIQARKWSNHLREHDAFFKPLIDLFNSATHSLSDIAAQISDHHDRHFEGGDHPDWFINSREILTEKSAHGQILALTTGPMYLVGGHVRLGNITELSESYLSALETRFPHLWLPAEDVLMDAEAETEKNISFE